MPDSTPPSRPRARWPPAPVPATDPATLQASTRSCLPPGTSAPRRTGNTGNSLGRDQTAEPRMRSGTAPRSGIPPPAGWRRQTPESAASERGSMPSRNWLPPTTPTAEEKPATLRSGETRRHSPRSTGTRRTNRRAVAAHADQETTRSPIEEIPPSRRCTTAEASPHRPGTLRVKAYRQRQPQGIKQPRRRPD